MLEIPYDFIVINHFLDLFILIFVSLSSFYYILYRYFKKEIFKIAVLDFKVFVSLLILAYINYNGMYFVFPENILGLYKIWWFWYFVSVYFVIETILFLFFSKKIGFSIKAVKKAVEDREKEKEKEIKKKQKEIKKMEKFVFFLEKELRFFEKKDVKIRVRNNDINYIKKDIKEFEEAIVYKKEEIEKIKKNKTISK